MRITTLPIAITVVLMLGVVSPLAPPAIAQEGQYAISGVVVSDTGEPLAGATVDAWTNGADGRSYSSDNTRSAADGSFTLHLNAGKGYVSVYYEEWRQSGGQEILVDGEQSGLKITLQTPPPKDATVSGVVTDLAGNPIEGANVNIWRTWSDYPATRPAEPEATTTEASSGSAGSATPADARIAPYPYYDDSAYATTDADGRFSFKVYAGGHQVTASAPGYAQSIVKVEAISGEDASVTLKLEKVPAADAVLVGKVVDAETGLPIQGAWVYVNNLEWSRYAQAQTGADGTFRLKTLPGWSQVSVSYYGYYPEPMPLAEGEAKTSLIAPRIETQYYSYVANVRLVSGETTHSVDLEPKAKPDLVLIGYVIDIDAQTGIPGATVNVWNQDTGDWGSATTDETGSYKILVRAGHYQVTAWANGYLGGAGNLVIRAGEPVTRYDVAMPEGTPKYAPCDYGSGDDGCGGVVYAKEGVAVADSDGTDASRSYAPTAPPSATPAAAGDQSGQGGPATYAGEGGGLPAYDPATSGEIPEGVEGAQRTGTTDGASAPTNGGSKTDAVPGVGLVLVLAILGLAALVLGRRSR